MAWDDREAVTETAGLDHGVGVTYSTCNYFYENLVCFGLGEFDVFDDEWSVCGLEDGGFVGFGEGRHFGDLYWCKGFVFDVCEGSVGFVGVLSCFDRWGFCMTDECLVLRVEGGVDIYTSSVLSLGMYLVSI